MYLIKLLLNYKKLANLNMSRKDIKIHYFNFRNVNIKNVALEDATEYLLIIATEKHYVQWKITHYNKYAN